MDVLKVARLSNGVVMATIGQCPPGLGLGLANSKQLCHVGGTGERLAKN